MKVQNKEHKQKPIKYLASFLASLMILFGAAACGSGTEEGEVVEDGVATEEFGYDTEVEDAENELVTNEEVDAFGEWDANADESLDATEFGTAFNDAGFYHDWDVDGDGFFSREEVNNGVYLTYDADDGAFTDDEWEIWQNAWGGELDVDLASWDENQDNMLDEEEYNAGLEDLDLYEGWDTDGDGLYSEAEIGEGIFDTWDDDDDELVEAEEYDEVEYELWGL